MSHNEQVPATTDDSSALSIQIDKSFDVRETMKEFWLQWDPEPESMMLCSAANTEFYGEDRAQILQMSPALHNARVLELGSGIGRFTADLAKLAKEVTTVDFMQSYVDKNRELNGHNSHVKFMVADVTELELPKNSFDVIFTNWLLMYLSVEEVKKLVGKMLGWLPDGGYLFVRESCYKPSGRVLEVANPTIYRSPLDYFKILQGTMYQSSRGQEFSFVCQRAFSVESYIKHYGNPFQLGFVLQKVPHAGDPVDSIQALLDGQQCTEDGIRKYEFIFGKTHVLSGGQATTEEFVKQLDLNESSKVLDVGCGIGGTAFHIARTCGSRVHGVDLSSCKIFTAVKYQAEMEDRVRKVVSFEMSDITKQDFESNSFDVIYSRDTILHIGEKESLFTKFFEWLKPGGTLMITDYCRGDKDEYSNDFLMYAQQRGYHLLSVYEYGHMLEKIGFEKVVADDRTNEFVDILHDDTKKFNERKKEFLQQFTDTEFQNILDGWKATILRCTAGGQAWGIIKATKPL